jgi:hypothetical protein
MNRDEHRLLLSERNALRRILDGIPHEDVLDRSSFEARLRAVEERLATAVTDTRVPARARLTFRGRPVIGSHGVFAKFGVKATAEFTDAVAMMAAGMSRPLAGVGPIPNRDENQLLITSTALGSFGFELEEYRQQPMLVEDESVVALALAQTQELLDATSRTDDELTIAVAGVDSRIISAVRTFLATLADNEATCALEFGNKKVTFQDVAQVRRGADRLAQENVHQEEQNFRGEFQGVLPKRRTFEFKIAADGSVIAGKVGPNIVDSDVLNQHLHRVMDVTFVATRIGSGRPRYVMDREPVWPSELKG